MQGIGINMFQMQQDMILLRADTAPFVNFHRHRPANHIAAGQILGGRGIAFHKTLAFGIGQIAAFAARSFGDENPGAIYACRVKLDKFHILQGQTCAQSHRITIACASMGRGTGEIHPAITACGQHRALTKEAMQRAIFHRQSQDALTSAIIIHNQVNRIIFDKKFCLVAQTLLIQRMQNCMAGTVSCGTGTPGNIFAIIKSVATKRTLIDIAFFGTRKRHAIMFQLNHRRDSVAAHIFNRILIAQPV